MFVFGIISAILAAIWLVYLFILFIGNAVENTMEEPLYGNLLLLVLIVMGAVWLVTGICLTVVMR